ncbi:MAG: OmpH family outer membrane protein [Nitrospiraceae bacterium]|nr:OmpH family outer membrane protein [Nitrospiraceae bacterium]
MKKKFTVFLGMFFCAVMFGSFATAWAAPLKIGVFDIREIMRTSKVTRGYAKALRDDINAKKKALQDKAAELKQLEDKLKNSKGMTASALAELRDKIIIKASDLKHDRNDMALEVRQMNQNLTQKALREIGGIITQIAKKDKYSIIFEKRAAGVVYFTKAVDITPEIISVYNAMQKKK